MAVPGSRPRAERVQKLHLVGVTTDHEGLILSARRGARTGGYVLTIDGALEEAVDELRARRAEEEAAEESTEAAGRGRSSRVESALSVREIQARLRQGRSVAEVARAAGVEPEWVDRFAVPVLAERAQVVTRVRSLPLRRARLGPSALPIGEAVRHHLADRGVALTAAEFDAAWTARQVADGRWVVGVAYRYRGRDHRLQFDLDERSGEVTAADRPSGELGYVAPGTVQRAGARRRSTPPSAPRPTAKRSVVSTGFRTERASAKPVSRSARERERATAAMRKAAEKRAVESERAAVRRERERVAAAARREREQRQRERAAAAAERAKVAAAKRAATEKAAADRAKAAAAKQAAADKARKAAEARRAAVERSAAAKAKKAAAATKAKNAADAKKATTAKAATEKRAAAKRTAAPKAAVDKPAAAPKAAAPPAKPATTVPRPTAVKATRETAAPASAVTRPVPKPISPTAAAPRPVPRQVAPTRAPAGVPTSKQVAATRPPTPKPAPVRQAVPPAPRPAPAASVTRPTQPTTPVRPAPTAITEVRPAPAVREPGDATLARPTFRTGLVEQVTSDGPTTNGSAPAPAPRPDRPRRTRPLRAT